MSNKKGVKIKVKDRFKFCSQKTSKDIQRLKCFLNNCKCFLESSLTLQIIEWCDNHNHEKCHQNVLDKQKLSYSIKRKAIRDISKRLSNFIRFEIKDFDAPTINTNDLI